ncbi:MAG TPA: DNA methyltransferase [Verrucomicrobiae bacterium]|jgi:site-specific DNA-methyltransferase (adenine-specific)|nr:DNA methyltransferase [Verrucomicrobiae bacterium]
MHGDCIDLMRTMPANCVDLILTDPPYVANYINRDGQTVYNDDNSRWLKPAFTEIHRLLKPNRYCISFYGWNHADRFLWHWKRIGLMPVGHLVFVKDYASKKRSVLSHHENAYLLSKGEPKLPTNPIRDVLQWDFSGNKLHPTQKPVSILTPLIVTFSEPGETVLDPFAGSGTTGVAARLCGRQFILIEKEWHHYQTARERISDHR